jgi:hypothetical protein
MPTQGHHQGNHMAKTNNSDKPQQTPAETQTSKQRRALLKKLGRFAAVTAPTVTLLLATTAKPKKAVAASPVFSSRQLKTIGEDIDAGVILAAVSSLPVGRWRYKSETGLEQETHIGPYAEDFKAAFGIGDGVTISTIDAIGVCLAAITALSAKVDSLEEGLQTASRKQAA